MPLSLSKTGRVFAYSLGVLIALADNRAIASIVLDGTRVIYPGGKSEVSLRMTNEGTIPKLVQIWIDDGDKQASPEQLKVPFTVLTPIFRAEPKKGQVVRIQHLKNQTLPPNKESVFWLNVLEIPPRLAANEPDANYLQFRYRTRIKLFYRPPGLPGTAADAPRNLIFKYEPGRIQIENPTAFFLSISSLEVGKDAAGGKVRSLMIAPFATDHVQLQGQLREPHPPLVRYRTINDFGGVAVYEKNAIAF